MAFSADAIANEFLEGRFGKLTPMKIQKLVYYAHAWHLALFDEPLINDRIEAWQFGPVIPVLYDEFKQFGDKPVTRFATEIDPESLQEYPERLPVTADREKALVRRIWNLLGNYSAIQLSNMSHNPNEPWFQIQKRRPGLAIPNELIKQCFKKILDAKQSEP